MWSDWDRPYRSSKEIASRQWRRRPFTRVLVLYSVPVEHAELARFADQQHGEPPMICAAGWNIWSKELPSQRPGCSTQIISEEG